MRNIDYEVNGANEERFKKIVDPDTWPAPGFDDRLWARMYRGCKTNDNLEKHEKNLRSKPEEDKYESPPCQPTTYKCRTAPLTKMTDTNTLPITKVEPKASTFKEEVARLITKTPVKNLVTTSDAVTNASLVSLSKPALPEQDQVMVDVAAPA